MIILYKKNKIFNWWFDNIKLKFNIKSINNYIYNCISYLFKNLYFTGINGFFKMMLYSNINFFHLKETFKNLKIQLNIGYIGYLFLNGIGFKCTKKIYNVDKRFWRFNVGHSQVFLYYNPKNVIMKVKQRFICFFGINKSQIFDIASKIKNFHIPDSYKGVGIKYPNEIITLKKGKTRQ